ncbi:MAG: PLP-dependent aminotransferase family protein [Puniceicoccaceae bacterium]
MSQAPASIRYSSVGETLEVPVINQLMSIPLEYPDILSLAAGFTDNAVLPSDLIGEIVAGLPHTNPNHEYLQYGTTQGRSILRKLTCDRLNALPMEQEHAFDKDLTFITNGSQQALFLATHTLCDPGDYVLVESPTYFVYLSMLQGLQVRPIGIPVDAQGRIDADALEAILQDLKARGELPRLKAAYLIGYHANPSSRCLKLWEKEAVARLLENMQCRIPVIEDAAYRELAYDELDPTPSIMSLPCFDAFPKLYLGTYTKPLATGLKIGYGTCSDPEWFAKMVCAKGNQDFGSSNFSQAIIEQVLLRNAYDSLTHQLGQHYGRKAELLDSTLREFGLHERGWHWEKPAGGLLFWLRAPESINTDMGEIFSEKCKQQGVIYVPGSFCFAPQAPRNFIRLSIGALCDDKLVEASRRFCEVASISS